MPENPSVDARKALEFLKTSELVNLKMPVQSVLENVSKLEEVAGYVIAWEKYVLVVASELEQVARQP